MMECGGSTYRASGNSSTSGSDHNKSQGKTPTDPRSKPIPSLEIPHHPAGQRPDTALPPPEASNFSNVGLGLMGFMPFASATFSSFGVSACLLGGVFSPLFSVQFHRYNRGYPGSRRRVIPETSQVVQTADENLKRILLVIIFMLIPVKESSSDFPGSMSF